MDRELLAVGVGSGIALRLGGVVGMVGIGVNSDGGHCHYGGEWRFSRLCLIHRSLQAQVPERECGDVRKCSQHQYALSRVLGK